MENKLYHKTTLANGLRIITVPMPHTRSVAVSIYVGAGSRYETEQEAGLSHFVEHLCFKGTERRPTSREISEAIDGAGGMINAGTDRELTVYYCKVAQPHFALAIDVLADLVRRPLFAPSELELERRVVLEELAMVADSPGQQVDLLLDETLWPNQPLGRDVAGSEESVRGLSREMVVGIGPALADGLEASFIEPGQAATELGEERLVGEADHASHMGAAADGDGAAQSHQMLALAIDADGDVAVRRGGELNDGVLGQHERDGGGKMRRDGCDDEAAGERIQDGAAGGERIAGTAGGGGDHNRVGADDADQITVDFDVDVDGPAQ